MAQARVTEFFSSRKKTNESQPAKRRKLATETTDVNVALTSETTRRTTRSRAANLQQNIVPTPPQLESENAPKQKVLSPVGVTELPKSGTKSQQKSATKRRGRKPKTATKASFRNQLNIRDAFENVSAMSTSGSESSDTDGKTVGEEVTSAWDEHDGIQKTPSKTEKNSLDACSQEMCISKKRTRTGSRKAMGSLREVEKTPLKEDVSSEEEDIIHKPSSARKKLQLRISDDESSGSENSDPAKEETQELQLPTTPKAISPLPETPIAVRQQLSKGSEVQVSNKVKNAMKLVASLHDKCTDEATTQKTAETIKEKLSKVKGMEDLKAQLASMKQTKSSLKKPVPKLKKFDTIEVPVDVKPAEPLKKEEPKIESVKVPAYQRFHDLASPAPPTLSLPYKYRLLLEMFRSTDTVVSMLHNRNECCTFSKLKTAVQEMTKRNFEEKNLGQMKTVYPTAYTFRQQKGLSAFGNKTTGYQLTVEADLPIDQENIPEGGKVTRKFTPKFLTDRKTAFSNSLIAVVKRHHKAFLASLDKPLVIPDDKLTRWHPKFRVDEVPDIESSPLPQPPDVQKITSAKEMLELQRGKLLPRVEKALEKVASTTKTQTGDTKNSSALNKPSSSSSVKKQEYKGIPQALLDKIRAKEVQKAEMAMTRNPEQEKRQEMLRRLPNLMRSLRTHFVTMKKPALPIEDIVAKLTESSESFITAANVESHVQLMVEVVPEWLKIIEIKKGKYVKMDRNVELQTVLDKVNKLSKSS